VAEVGECEDNPEIDSPEDTEKSESERLSFDGGRRAVSLRFWLGGWAGIKGDERR
jgi:hypothetical protein